MQNFKMRNNIDLIILKNMSEFLYLFSSISESKIDFSFLIIQYSESKVSY